jgi:hypothetical protein
MFEGDGKPVIREIQSGDYRIRLDLSRQVLRLSVPEEPVTPHRRQPTATPAQPANPGRGPTALYPALGPRRI